MANKVIKMNTIAIRMVIAVFALYLLIAGSAALGLFDITAYTLQYFLLSSVLVLFVDIGLLSIIKSKGKGVGFGTAFEIIIGIATLALSLFSLLKVQYAPLIAIQGFVIAIFGITFFIEAFLVGRKGD